MQTLSGKTWLILGLLALSGCAGMPFKSRAVSKTDPELSMARLCESQGNPGKAREIYASILKKTPKSAEAHHRLGVMDGTDGDLASAEAHLTKANSLKPNDPQILADRSYVHYLSSKYDLAEADARLALKADPHHKQATVNLALAVGGKGDLKESYNLFRTVLKDSEAASNIAYLHLQKGNVEEAKTWYARALTADSKNRKAAVALVQLHKTEQQAIAARQKKDAGSEKTAARPKSSGIVQVSAEEPAP